VRQKGFEPDEVEDAFLDPRRLGAPTYNDGSEKRSGCLGATGSRILFLVSTRRNGKVRIITIRDASPAEKRRYRTRGK
jgi:uncharacterized DUF497 family protein